jgi:hypothetical protein
MNVINQGAPARFVRPGRREIVNNVFGNYD